MVERRKGGETGIRSVQMIEGDAVWRAGRDGVWSEELLISALSRGDSPKGLPDEDGRTIDLFGTGELQQRAAKPVAYLIEYLDGTRGTLLMLNGGSADYCFAARLKGESDPVSTQFFITPLPNVNYSASLVHKICEMLETGVSPIPVKRTQIVSGMLEACLDSKMDRSRKRETDHLRVDYAPPVEPQHFCS
jgi:hypothetical protein